MEKLSSVTVTSFSQPHVLQTRMKEEQLSHGGTVKAHLSPVRVDMDHGAAVMYFCPMQNLQVLEVIAEGDGGNIPAEVRLEGLNIPSRCHSGLYDLKNVEFDFPWIDTGQGNQGYEVGIHWGGNALKDVGPLDGMRPASRGAGFSLMPLEVCRFMPGGIFFS